MKKIVEINGKKYFTIKGYPKFGFYIDEETKKYSIANIETNEVTEPFVDELIYSEVPLETWTADYVVVRIGDKYYLADNNGNCFFASDEPFIICRNIFVSGKGKSTFLVNKNLEITKSTPDSQIIVEGIEGFNFAFFKCLNPENKKYRKYLINTLGRKVVPNNSYMNMDFTSLHNWHFESEKNEFCCVINSEFDVVKKGDQCHVFGSLSKTCYVRQGYSDTRYSVYFGAEIQGIECHGEFEIVKYNNKTYFFKANGDVEETNTNISYLKDDGSSVVYRQGNEIFERDSKGEIIASEKISSKERYFQSVFEDLLKRLK